MDRLVEANIDGIIGPSHHFGGLGVGNVASQSSRLNTSCPRDAALAGLAKQELLSGLGIPQYFLPPLPRPNWDWLASVGFGGDRGDALKQCFDQAPAVLSSAYSSSFMWTANAATIAPSSDTRDNALRIVLANLISSMHRGMEAGERQAQVVQLLGAVPNGQVLAPLPSVYPLRDEGAANHMRLCDPVTRRRALHVFVHEPLASTHRRFESRQSKLASTQVALRLGFEQSSCLFLEQSQEAIDAGVFHNDVIATSHDHLLLCHEDAYEQQEDALDRLQQRFARETGCELVTITVERAEVTLVECVRTYLFNSQIVQTPSGETVLICPDQCRTSIAVHKMISKWIANPNVPIDRVCFVSLAESMANGGGPACLRLRIDLDENQMGLLYAPWRLTPERAGVIREWIQRTYPTSLNLEDLSRLDFADHVLECVRNFPFL